MEIRPATAPDVPAVVKMVRKLCELHQSWDPARYTFREDVERMYQSWLTDRTADPRAFFLVAERQERGPVAFLIGGVEREIRIYKLEEYGFIHDLWVEEDYRNEGLGRQLVMRAIERFGELGVRQVRLDTAAANDAARKLFASCGFRVSVMEMLWEQ
jgi:ribosomal protein S18 acetylase RimI-like enzyme